jgi:hypothetical protein
MGCPAVDAVPMMNPQEPDSGCGGCCGANDEIQAFAAFNPLMLQDPEKVQSGNNSQSATART